MLPDRFEHTVDVAATLEAIGVQPLEFRAYRLVLNHPSSTLAELLDALGIASSNVRSALAGLEAKGLVTAEPTRPRRYTAAAPQVAIEALVQQQLGMVTQARVVAETLQEQYHRATGTRTLEAVELLSSPEAIGKRFSQMEQTAEREVMILERPPYFLPDTANFPNEVSMLDRGIRVRAIYDQDALALPGRLDAIRQEIKVGEEARYIPKLPLKLAIIDDAAVVSLLAHPDDHRTLIVDGTAVVAGLKLLFELLWERATPLDTMAGDRHDVPDRDLVTLLAAGLPDSAIARQLEVSPRTIARRVSRLMDALDTRSRFQAGIRAAQRGWLGEPV